MAILVSGGAGYIGSHTCVELLAAGYDIVVADNYYNSCPEALARVKKIAGKDFRFVEADMTDKAADEKIFAENEDIACVIVEAVAGNMNMVPATQEFIDTARALCTKYGALLIVDEVMTGFRVALGGAQSIYRVTPDITMFGKVIGGGMPVGAYGGRREIMQLVAPLGSV